MKSMQEKLDALIDGGDSAEMERRILSAVDQHDQWRSRECLNMHAGKNVMSNKARQLLSSMGLVDNGASGSIGSRHAAGAKYIDEIESLTVALLRKLYHAHYIEYRAMSGSIANGIALSALTRPGDTIMVVPKRYYGHYTYLEGGYPRHLGLQVKEIPFTEDGFQLDIDTFRKRAIELRPSLIIVGTSIYLFPTPLEEIRRIADTIGAMIMYDGAHVLGLIAGGQFQDPLSQGAHILVGSTQKTFPGPIGGILVCNDKEIGTRVSQVTSELFSNYCNNRVAALAMTAAEMIRFGREYAMKVVSNARALAEALDSEGLPVLGKAYGYSASHQVILDAMSVGGAKRATEILEKANIICTYFSLSSDYSDHSKNPNGIRLGVSALSRLGMGSDEMKQIAYFIKQALINPDRAQKVGEDVKSLVARFRKVHYSFDLEENPLT
jgi:glycine hydroxymethyltransferase